MTSIWSNLDNATVAERPQIRLRCRMVIHQVLHRRSDEQRRGGGEDGGSEHVVGETMREPSDCLRGRGDDDDCISLVSKGDVSVERLTPRGEDITIDRSFGQRLEG